MVYVVKFQAKSNGRQNKSQSARILFAQSGAEPSREKAVQLLSAVTDGDFLEDSIEIHELRDFDPIGAQSQGTTVFSL